MKFCSPCAKTHCLALSLIFLTAFLIIRGLMFAHSSLILVFRSSSVQGYQVSKLHFLNLQFHYYINHKCIFLLIYKINKFKFKYSFHWRFLPSKCPPCAKTHCLALSIIFLTAFLIIRGLMFAHSSLILVFRSSSVAGIPGE